MTGRFAGGIEQHSRIKFQSMYGTSSVRFGSSLRDKAKMTPGSVRML